MNNKQIYAALDAVNKSVSERITERRYVDIREEKMLFYISQQLFMALNHAQDILNYDLVKNDVSKEA